MGQSNLIKTPIGNLFVQTNSTHVIAVKFDSIGLDFKGNNELILEEVGNQLEEYFSGKRKNFNLPLAPCGTAFQQQVWNALNHVPYGETISYQALAIHLGNEKGIRAAAAANGKNPFLIINPCHRIIGKNGQLVGYSGELWRKQFLLEHESKIAGKSFSLFD